MSKAQQAVKMTFDEFIEWNEEQEGRWELHSGVPVRLHDPVKGHSERLRHIRVKQRIVRAFETALANKGKECEALADGATIKIDDETSYEPDAVVYCGDRIGGDELVVPNPVVIVEVLSPSTAYKDISDKLIDYFKLPSVMHYLIVDPASGHIQHHFRDGEQIEVEAVHGPDLQLDPPGLSLSLADLFD